MFLNICGNPDLKCYNVMLQDQIEDLQNQHDRQKKELKKKKDREANLHTEIDDLREELGNLQTIFFSHTRSGFPLFLPM